MNYENQPMDACAKTVSTQQGYSSQILEEIRELQNLAETIHSKIYELAGQCQPTQAGCDEEKMREPQNFCEHTLRDLKRVRTVMYEALDHAGNL